MKKKIAQVISSAVIKRPLVIFLTILLILGLSLWQVQKLKINFNQIELIPQNLQSIKSSKEMMKMLGGVGYMLLVLKGNDMDHVKRVSDDLAPRINALPEIRGIAYKKDFSFVFNRVAYYAKTEDLEEGFQRVRKLIKQTLKDSLGFSLSKKKKKEKIVFDDLIKKYSMISKKTVDDDYGVDPGKTMLVMVIKPKGDAVDLELAARVHRKVDNVLKKYNKENKRKAVLKEHYSGLAKGSTVTYGYTGDFKRNLDDSVTVQKALQPVAVVAFFAIFLILILFLRRISQVMMIMTTLVASVIMTYGFCMVTIGELNIITATLSAILMGFGIDFGIHFMYRMREEYSHRHDLHKSIEEAIEHSGAASTVSAFTAAAAFFLLLIAEFKGFSHFGLVAGAGVIITALMMYILLPVLYVLVDKVFPNFKNTLIVKKKEHENIDLEESYPHAKKILIGSSIITLIFAIFAINVTFNYDGRVIMSGDNPSTILLEEVSQRMQMSIDPAAIYTETLEDTKILYDKLIKIAEKKDSAIDSVISLYTLVPPLSQQEANREILIKLQDRIEDLDPSMFKDKKMKDNLGKLKKYIKIYLSKKNFEIKDLPKHLYNEFLPEADSGYKGFLTYIYPKPDIWAGDSLVKYADYIGRIDIKEKPHYAAGISLLFADLTRIVVRDGVRIIVLAFIAIFLIIWLYFRDLKSVFLSMTPLVAGMIWMLGLMTIFNQHINYINLVVLPVVFGYGISCGIQLFHRYYESGSVMYAVRQTGAAVAASSITTIAGWAALFVANHRGLTSMGALACFGIGASLIVSFTVMPAMLQVFDDMKKKRQEETA